MENVVLSLGQKLVASDERMNPVTLVELYEYIAHADSAFTNQIEVLRSIRRMDSAKYSLMKKSLPYFVCAHFEPAIRKQDNFSSVSSFVLDIDNVYEDALALTDLKKQLGRDSRIAMMFTSPGETESRHSSFWQNRVWTTMYTRPFTNSLQAVLQGNIASSHMWT